VLAIVSECISIVGVLSNALTHLCSIAVDSPRERMCISCDLVSNSSDCIRFCGLAPEGRNVYRCSLTKSFLSPSGAADPRSGSLLVELASFFLPERYTFRAAGASQIFYPQNPMRSVILSYTPLDRPGSCCIDGHDGHAGTRILLLTLLTPTNILSSNHMIRGSDFAGMMIHAGG
jgi:hypothetical protein